MYSNGQKKKKKGHSFPAPSRYTKANMVLFFSRPCWKSVRVVARQGLKGTTQRQKETSFWKKMWREAFSLILPVSNSKVGLLQQANTMLAEQCGKGIFQNNWTSNSSFYETIAICFFLYVSHLGNKKKKKVKAMNKGGICFLPLQHSEHPNNLPWNSICNPDLFPC